MESELSFMNLVRSIIELEHHDNNTIEKNSYMDSMGKAVYQITDVFSCSQNIRLKRSSTL